MCEGIRGSILENWSEASQLPIAGSEGALPKCWK